MYFFMFISDLAADKSTIDTLSEAAENYFLNLTKLLRHAVDDEAMTGQSGFAVSI